MDSGLLNVFHDPADYHFRTVAECVHIDFDGLVVIPLNGQRSIGQSFG